MTRAWWDIPVADASTMSPFPFLNTPAFGWVTLAAAVLFAVAIVIVLVRNRAAARRLVAIEWERVEQLLDERGVRGKERERFLGVLKRYRPNDPLTAATRRHEFGVCVGEAIDQLRGDDMLRAGVELHEVRMALGLDYIPFGQRIDCTRELHTGQELWLALASDATPRWCRAQVHEVDEARFVVVSRGEAGDASREFREGVTLRCRLWREDDARYLFDLVVRGVESAPLRWTFHHTRDMQRIQDRAHYRIRVDASADIDVLNAPRDENYEGVAGAPAVTTFHARVINLSAGGVAIVSNQAIPKQVLLRFALVIPEAGRLTLIAKPVETSPQSGGRYVTRAYFVGLEEESRDAIARFVLHRQQKLIAPAKSDKVTLQ